VPKYIVLRTYPSYYYLESHFINICSTIVQDARHDDFIFKIIGTFLFIACSKPPPHFYSTHGLFPFQFNLLLSYCISFLRRTKSRIEFHRIGSLLMQVPINFQFLPTLNKLLGK